MNFLFVTQYFPPETGAPQNRLFQLAKRLQSLGVTVTVLTAMPNYPKMRIFDGYKGKFYCREIIDGIPVHRCWIYAGTSKAIIPRLINYFSFVFTSLIIGFDKLGRQDFVMCESPPLFLGISAWFLTRTKGAELIFNVSDLWPESAEKLGLITSKSLLNLATKLEEFLYRNAILVTGQTQGIVSDIQNRFPAKEVIWLKNGVDPQELEQWRNQYDWRAKEGFTDNDFILLYAGIIGHAQGLDVILQAAGLLREHTSIKFVIAGSGPVLDDLLKLQKSLNLTNVIFYENRPKKDVVPMIEAADAAIIPLKKIDLFKGAIPSKIFENLALETPVLLGVEGEAREIFIDNAGAGWAYEPENHHDLAGKILNIFNHRDIIVSAGKSGSAFVLEEFNMDTISKNFLEILKKLKKSYFL